MSCAKAPIVLILILRKWFGRQRQSTWWFYPSASFPPFSAFSRHLHRAWFIFKPTRWFFRFFMTLVFFFTFAWFLSSFLSHPCSSHRLPQTTMTTIKLDSSSGAWVSTVVDSLARFIPLWDDNFFSCYQRNAFHGAPSTKWSWLNRFVFSWCCHLVWCHRKKWHAIKALRLVLSIQINYDVKSFFFLFDAMASTADSCVNHFFHPFYNPVMLWGNKRKVPVNVHTEARFIIIICVGVNTFHLWKHWRIWRWMAERFHIQHPTS